MKSTGIVRSVDPLGRMVIPSELRESFGVKDGKGAFEIFVDNDSIILKKYEPTCVFCGNNENITIFKDRNVCEKCIKELQNNL